jgi:uncharacterized protein
MLKHPTETATLGLPPPLFTSAQFAVPSKSLPAPELKRAATRLTSIDTAAGTFSGYASLFGVADLGGDIVVKGAFRRSLAQRGPRGVKLLFQHDPSQPIGVWLSLAEDHRGLLVEGRLMPEVAKAREVLALMRAGALDGLSIGFRTVKGSRDPTTGLRRLQEIDLWEISVVTFPMQADARVAIVKSSAPKPPAGERQLITRLRRASRDLHSASSSSVPPSVH